MSLPTLAIVTPYLADANNGNWRTARRWQSLLEGEFRSIVHNAWPTDTKHHADLLIALHARRNAEAVRQFRKQYPEKPIVVVLTGTDLYRDLGESVEAKHAISVADALIVLQEDAIRHVPAPFRRKTHVIYQSAKPLQAATKAKGRLDCVVVGHLRGEKSPETIFRLVEAIPPSLPIRLLHIGAGLDPLLAAEAQALAGTHSNYRWAGALPHGLARTAIKRAHVLIHPSIMEGGANVIVEAITSGTPVIASHISGNIGMLGREYPGYFPVGDEMALLALLRRCVAETGFLSRLNTACAARAKLFLPESERASLSRVLHGLLARGG